MKKLNLINLVVGLITGLCFSNMAIAEIEFSLKAKDRPDLAIGAVASIETQTTVFASGIISQVDFVQMLKEGVMVNVSAVTFNESKLPSGDVETDTIYFSGADAPLGLSLSGAIGKKIQVNTQTRSFTISEK